MTTSTAQQAALQSPVVNVVYFAQFDFLSGTQRLSTWNHTITWGDHEWLGVGALTSIGAVEESDSVEPKSLTFTLAAAEPTWLALAVGAVEEYRGRRAKLYMCPLNENYAPIDTPVLCWAGIMDMVAVGIEREEGQISLKCETSAYGLKRRPSLRLTAAQQRKRYPNDGGLDFLVDLQAHPEQLWLSRRLQKSLI